MFDHRTGALKAVPPPPTYDHMERYYREFGNTMELFHLDGAIGRQVRGVKAALETAEKVNQSETAAGLKLAQATLEDAREALRR